MGSHDLPLAQAPPEAEHFFVAIGVASSREAGWCLNDVGLITFMDNRITVVTRRWIAGSPQYPVGWGGLVGEIQRVRTAEDAYKVLEIAGTRRNLEGKHYFAGDPAKLQAIYDPQKSLAKIELDSGRWVVVTLNGDRSRGKLTNRVAPNTRQRFGAALRDAFGNRLIQGRIRNRRTAWALKVLWVVVLPLLLFLIILAILGFSGLLD